MYFYSKKKKNGVVSALKTLSIRTHDAKRTVPIKGSLFAE